MSARIHLRQILVLSLVVCALAGGAIYWFRARSGAVPSNLVAYLPTANASVFYCDVDALRRSGILEVLVGSKAAEEPDYQQFVRETKFDYRNDLDTIAAATKAGRIYFALRGRFHWDNLRDYASHQGGSCHNDFCVLPGSQPNRRISFYLVKRNVLAMAVGPDDFGAYQISPQQAKLTITPPQEPVWALIPAVALQGIDLPSAAAKQFVPALRDAQQIVFSLGADHDRQLQLGLHVTCKDAPAATALQSQLQELTKALRNVLANQHQKPDPADLSNLLVAGSFRRDQLQVFGAWPIPKAFVEAIAGNGY